MKKVLHRATIIPASMVCFPYVIAGLGPTIIVGARTLVEKQSATESRLEDG